MEIGKKNEILNNRLLIKEIIKVEVRLKPDLVQWGHSLLTSSPREPW
jgi:hypothetical protein